MFRVRWYGQPMVFTGKDGHIPISRSKIRGIPVSEIIQWVVLTLGVAAAIAVALYGEQIIERIVK
ncbi:MAG: hypothetical protein A3I07_03685 [Candidatus Doudnabacteria bacterium RIFCSPLOWO2_02_FULL_42_9]|uniref:Uncharacterized protein n=1 Tax=Candidatus Doudnabacteria bacterium RIFCSPHIGHO2_01_FULL_41_86 TaxID=1817821 RepID=A0A1F5N9L3_9BACT|nr:MAG: hypothetical protein A2717_02340 [Candidatus Doudnabacteria bacterium RIFCSPHIGHO2_01_FULL_41_86]OGE75600.1 MAG: hypothetical protein A3K07_02100 [Candidatus Doudnabacteria bacterium RIFCSPHIGHO2_01_43_10]OGE85395.1 MAG: hypothetical protein A3E28_01910 [Candidatus Doudnabacteria bacterium RIFCSPHIGHO2_12_FULL_42_22]OGE86933.1 MAG: hypothetical protein A3C49_02745 [Candidatus Doudnabacteria bacterium RIFCSPHIGHO2_02_FULL_42_25]OGE92532.1 MAG: hypothetical protein A2895_02900 [Candidatus